MKFNTIACVVLWCAASAVSAQTLTLEQAIEQVTQRYPLIKSKEAQLQASIYNTQNQKGNYFPDLTFGAQQSYGTINAQNGPLYAYGGLGSAATSMPLAEQNWNAAFGSLYFANVNWNLFSFGKTRQGVAMTKAQQSVAQQDLAQEIFKQQVKASATYFNLLAAQRIVEVQQRNLERAKVFYTATEAKVKSGLIAQVDERLAQAEVAFAETTYIKAYDKELEWDKQLSDLLDIERQSYELDSLFYTAKPLVFEQEFTLEHHPILQWQEQRVKQSQTMEKLVHRGSLPQLNAFGIIQGRGSGFDWNYVQDNTAFTKNYSNGVGIDRSNYLVGLQLTWNISHFFRTTSKVKEQEKISQSLQEEYAKMDRELTNQVLLTKEQYDNAASILTHSTIEVQAATVAFNQQQALYENGLSDLVAFTQALYTLQRAEIAFEVAQNNIWQALLMQASAQGDIQLLVNAIPQK
ncbi:TolC family protein [Myroides odoratus]|uniref:TolC family protein n=1 Tax=Myroides odoratus TaxID=256 RepID=UPI002168A300|nr:TolC family protein [Myroides odoratus]MCS4240125.1 outer membrane protein TolC [Myroides odoratus]